MFLYLCVASHWALVWFTEGTVILDWEQLHFLNIDSPYLFSGVIGDADNLRELLGDYKESLEEKRKWFVAELEFRKGL